MAFDGAFVAEGGEVGGVGGGGCKVEEALADGAEVAARIREETRIATAAVGLITTSSQAEQII